MSNFEQVACNLCADSNYKVIFPAKYSLEKDKDYALKFRSSGDELLIDQLVECSKCGLIYINPRLRKDIILDAYSKGEDKVFISQAKARELTFKKCLNKIEEFYPQAGKILDIGTAGGSFLYAAKQSGWEVYGCEPNRWLCEWGRRNYGIEIKPGDLFQQNYQQDFFDVVTLWDVLEHTHNPKEVLKECHRILKKNGLLVVNYPDIGSWIARIMGRKWVFLLSVHLYYFTPKTINLLLKSSGFSILKIKPHFQQLTLKYIFSRSKAHSGIIGSMGENISELLGLGNLNVPYWIGQTLVIAKKQ